MTIVISSLICLYTLEAYISNNMDPDQTAPLGVHNVFFHDQEKS